MLAELQSSAIMIIIQPILPLVFQIGVKKYMVSVSVDSTIR